jgi:hypothetical protein
MAIRHVNSLPDYIQVPAYLLVLSIGMANMGPHWQGLTLMYVREERLASRSSGFVATSWLRSRTALRGTGSSSTPDASPRRSPGRAAVYGRVNSVTCPGANSVDFFTIRDSGHHSTDSVR